MKTRFFLLSMAVAVSTACDTEKLKEELCDCNKDQKEKQTSDPNKSDGEAPKEETFVWNFENKDGWRVDNQRESPNEHIDGSSIVDCFDNSSKDKKALKIVAKKEIYERKKLRTNLVFGSGIYEWRAYISDLKIGERASIGSWLYGEIPDDKHELDFEVGSGTIQDRKDLKITGQDNYVVVYISSQGNPAMYEKAKLEKNSWHTFKIDLTLVDGKYNAKWYINNILYAEKQLDYGEECPFAIYCSTENLLFTGETVPLQDNYGLWDYVSYTPHKDSMKPRVGERK